MKIRICQNCGHEGRYASDELATHHFPRHSCELVRERRARAQRRLDGLASSGAEKPCTCKTVHHEHGDRLRYVRDKCRCHPCKVSQREYEQDRRRDRAYGRSRLVDAEPARQHVLGLMRGGMGLKRVAQVAGVYPSLLGSLVYGRGGDEARPPRKQIAADVERTVLAVQLDLADGAVVDGTGTMRRMQALVAIGWSQSKIAAAIGMQAMHVGCVIHGRRAVTVATRRAVSELYDRWWNTQPPAANQREKISVSRSTTYARERGWAPPMAWDDDAIDDPAASAVVGIPPAGRARVDAEDIEWLLDQNLTRAGICNRLKVSEKSLQTILVRAGREDLWRRVLEVERRRRTMPREVA